MNKSLKEFAQQEAEKCAAHLAICLKMHIDSMYQPDVWTPCNVALPTKSGRYMVTIKSKAKRRTEMRNFDVASQTWESECKWTPENIIAWQERPAPYTPQE